MQVGVCVHVCGQVDVHLCPCVSVCEFVCEQMFVCVYGGGCVCE